SWVPGRVPRGACLGIIVGCAPAKIFNSTDGLTDFEVVTVWQRQLVARCLAHAKPNRVGTNNKARMWIGAPALSKRGMLRIVVFIAAVREADYVFRALWCVVAAKKARGGAV